MRFPKECAWPAGPPEKVSVRRKSSGCTLNSVLRPARLVPNSKFERRLQLSPMPQMNDWFRAQRRNAV